MSTVAGQQPRVRRWGSSIWLMAGVAVLAFAVRLVPVLTGGGLGFYGRYDDGVYYSAADALIFGRLPYRDFVLLHPPGILLVLAPFALLGRVTSDPAGMAVARVAFMGVGALNAVLVTALALRWGRRSAIAAGVLYACWLAASYSETSTLLEPLGGTALLVALLLLLHPSGTAARPHLGRDAVLAGVALGLACTLKIWYVAPLLVVILGQLAARRPATAVRSALGAAVALVVVLLPFLVLAPTRMWDMVVRDQLLRPEAASSGAARLSGIVGVHDLITGHPTQLRVVTVIAVAVLLAAAVACWIERSSRLIVAVLVGNMVVLFAGPSYFAHYAALTAVPAALVVGIALGRPAPRPRFQPVWTTVLVLAVLAFLASGVRIITSPAGKTFPSADFAAAAPGGCITADDPQALIQMNRLSRDLRDGCRVEIDVTGITYDSLRRIRPNGKPAARRYNKAFQQYLYDYLLSGSAFTVLRPAGDGFPTGSPRRLGAGPRWLKVTAWFCGAAPGRPVDPRPPVRIADVPGTARKVRIVGDPVLAVQCRPVSRFDQWLADLVDDMFATMAVAEGVGLAAPQIGVDAQVFVYDCPDADGVRRRGHVVNPLLVSADGPVDVDEEGCLSVPGPYHDLPRASRVTVRGVDRTGAAVEISGTDYLARCLLHETDHLRGILYIDHLPRNRRRRVIREMEPFEWNAPIP